MEAKELAKKIFDALEDKKGEDIKIINISEVTVLADYLSLPAEQTGIRYRQWQIM